MFKKIFQILGKDEEISTNQNSDLPTSQITLPPYLSNLNERQLEAVKSTFGYIRIIAGAGTGKTKVLTSRYLYLIDELNVPFKNILCVTFTNKAANEMRNRIKQSKKDADLAYICTFHGFCVKVLREEYNYINYPKSFTILDKEDQKNIIKYIKTDLNLDDNYKITKIVKKIDKFKTNKSYIEDLCFLTPKELLDKSENCEDLDSKIFYRFLYEQKKNYSFDFNDLIIATILILSKYNDVLEKWSSKLQFIQVDEFQDVSQRQYQLIKMLSSYHNNLFIVGDPDQTIYSFRGAQVRLILDFDKNFKNTKTIILEENYRSTENILNSSNSLIEHNMNRMKKNLFSFSHIKGETVFYNHFKTNFLQSEWVSKTINHLHKERNIDYNDFAILYRNHSCSRGIEEALLKENIPYVIYSGISFYEREEIKDVLSFIKLIVYQDDLSFRRIINKPKRNFGLKKMKIIQDFAELNNISLYESLIKCFNTNTFIRKADVEPIIQLVEKYKSNFNRVKITDLVADILSSTGYRKHLEDLGDNNRLDNLQEFLTSILLYENNMGENTNIEEYLQDISLLTSQDKENDRHTVKLMTIHAAKGLEFPYVFVIDLNEGIFPSSQTSTREQMEEERRLAYVAMTRAKSRLFLTDSEGSGLENFYRIPSRFIINIKKELLEYSVELEENLIVETNARIQRFNDLIEKNEKNDKLLKYIKINDHIKHRALGIGEILEINENEFLIKFDKIQNPIWIIADSEKIEFYPEF